MLGNFEASLADPNLLGLRADISLIDARLAELLKRVDTGESGSAWSAAGQAFADFEDATADKDMIAARKSLQAIGEVIRRGLADEAAWSDIRQTIEQRRRLVESERKRLVEMQQIVTGEEMMTLITVFLRTLKERVHDIDVLAAIQADIERYFVARAD
jgi:hypothetical protein